MYLIETEESRAKRKETNASLNASFINTLAHILLAEEALDRYDVITRKKQLTIEGEEFKAYLETQIERDKHLLWKLNKKIKSRN